MTISAVNPTGIYNPLTSLSPAETPEEHVLQPAEEEAAISETAETEPVETAAEAESEFRGKGVLRLLQAGHFKGVADVRLRINFHEEIAALEVEKAAQVTADSVANISETVISEIDSYLGEEIDEATASLITEAQDAFAAELARIAGDGELSGEDDAVAQVQSAFDSLVSSITPVPEEQPEESPEVVPTETVMPDDAVIASAKAAVDETEATPETIEDSSLGLEDFIAQLTESFTAALAEMETGLDNISVLPPLSESSGNGKAYDKFVALYNDLRGVSQPEEVAPSVETIA